MRAVGRGLENDIEDSEEEDSDAEVYLLQEAALAEGALGV